MSVMRSSGFLTWLPGLLAAIVPCTAVAKDPVRLRVLTYNIHHAEGIDRKLDVERIASVITSVNPDIVALQEVDQKVARTKGVDQPAELARLTEMNVAFGMFFSGSLISSAIVAMRS